MADTVTLEEFKRRLDELLRGGLLEELRRTLLGVALYGEAQVKTNIHTRLRTRSARLIRSASGEVVDHEGEPAVRLSAGGPGEEVPYAGAQEEGATIRPRSSRYLTIPLSNGPALTGAGVPRYPSARDVPGLFVVRSRSGRLLLAKRGAGGRLEPWYLLHPGPITIRGKHYLRDAAEKTSERMQQDLAKMLEVQLEDISPEGG